MEEEILQLNKRVEELERQVKNFGDYSRIPYEVEKAFIARGFVSSHDSTSLTAALIAIGAKHATTFYVAGISGGAVTTPVTVVDGLVTVGP